MKTMQEGFEKVIQEHFEWVDDVEDGKYFYPKAESGCTDTNPFVGDLLAVARGGVERMRDEHILKHPVMPTMPMSMELRGRYQELTDPYVAACNQLLDQFQII